MRDRKIFGLVSAIGLSLLSTQAFSATVRFGSALDHQPTPPESCRAGAPFKLCSWVIVRGRDPGHEKAPKDGIVTKIRLLSCTAGSFVLQIARATPATHSAKVVRSGPLINYKGDRRNCDGRDSNFIIEVFPVHVPVHTGDYLAVAATKVGFIYSSGDREDVFDPPLPDGGPVRTTTNTGLGSGIVLLQAQY
jgi:hypothetical protein